jgi:hypothetical protein
MYANLLLVRNMVKRISRQMRNGYSKPNAKVDRLEYIGDESSQAQDRLQGKMETLV